ncbi:MAG: hypothetical protein M3Z23_00125 [Acidobacteriota bacterium]|nr:hypothetical protein [Acidobacteriota bacterium]
MLWGRPAWQGTPWRLPSSLAAAPDQTAGCIASEARKQGHREFAWDLERRDQVGVAGRSEDLRAFALRRQMKLLPDFT